MAQVRSYDQPATLAAGSRVVVLVSQGPAPQQPYALIEVPRVAGGSQGTALTALQNAGLQARVVNDYSDTAPRGRVMGQMPAAGTTAPSGSDVVLLVSSGRPISDTTAVPLPDVVGLPEADAIARLQAAGFSPQVARDFSPTVPAGIVMAQLPDRTWTAMQATRKPAWWIWAAAGLLLALLVLAGIWLLTRGADTTVPDVVGMDQAQAVEELADAGLVARPEAAQVETDAPVGTVVGQDPDAGTTVRRGSEVAIQVLAGEDAVRVPDVVGLKRDAATARLQQAGFRVSVVEQESADAQPGEVVEQRPPAGSELPPGSQVAIVVARAEEQAAVTVPNVIGLTRADAEATVEEVGLRLLVVENPSADVAAGVVALQYPADGDEVVPGATVALVVSSGPPEDATTAAVPNVVGDERQDAQETLADAGFSSQLVPVEGTDETADDVIAQLPRAGEAIPPRSTVVLFYAR